MPQVALLEDPAGGEGEPEARGLSRDPSHTSLGSRPGWPVGDGHSGEGGEVRWITVQGLRVGTRVTRGPRAAALVKFSVFKWHHMLQHVRRRLLLPLCAYMCVFVYL